MRIVACALLSLAALAIAAPSNRLVLFKRSNPAKGWMDKGRASLETTVDFMVAVRQQNLKQLEQTFWAISDPTNSRYRDFMTPAEIDAMVAPKPAHSAAVADWLMAAGCSVQAVGSDAFRVTATVFAAEQMLSTRFHQFQHLRTGRLVVRQMGEYSIPAALAEAVDMITGVAEFPVPRYGHTDAAPSNGAVIVPQTIETIYGTPKTAPAQHSMSSEGVIEFEGQDFSPRDLAQFATAIDRDIKPLSADHIKNNNPSFPGTEAQLDIEYVAGVGRGVTNWFWLETGSAWLYGWATNFMSSSQVPNVVSISYGWNELQQCQQGIGGSECQQLGVNSIQYVQRVNTEFMKIGVRGVSIVVASGDSGTNGRTDGLCAEKKFFPAFPAASPYVTAVGATQLDNAKTGLPKAPPACAQFQCAVSGEEVAVSYAQAHFASGGGFSNIAAMPSYQKDAVQAYFNSGVSLPPASYYNATGRGFPDVAAFGSAILISQGNLQTVGGTSASSPIFAGTMALINNEALKKTGKPLGFLNPLLYKMHADMPSAFHDIIKGDNHCTEEGCGFGGSCKGFTCAKGWDPVTGLGSPVYPQMLKYVTSML